MKHTPYRLASHLRFAVEMGAGRPVSVPENHCVDMPMDTGRQSTPRSAWFAIAAVFFVNGVTLASWISRIPTLTERLALSPGQVGIALMALAAGALVAFPIAGRLIDTRSSAFTVLCFGLVMILALPFVG